MALSNKQRVFVDEYLICLNASEAARRAGYNGKSNVIGSQIMSYPHIKQAIQDRLAEISNGVDDTIKSNSILQLPVIAEKCTPNKVYFIQAENGLVKIGIASNIWVRLNTFNTASPIELTLLFWIDSNEAKKLENSFHKIFESKRVKGEWFRLTSEDLTWIRSNYGIIE